MEDCLLMGVSIKNDGQFCEETHRFVVNTRRLRLVLLVLVDPMESHTRFRPTSTTLETTLTVGLPMTYYRLHLMQRFLRPLRQCDDEIGETVFKGVLAQPRISCR